MCTIFRNILNVKKAGQNSKPLLVHILRIFFGLWFTQKGCAENFTQMKDGAVGNDQVPHRPSSALPVYITFKMIVSSSQSLILCAINACYDFSAFSLLLATTYRKFVICRRISVNSDKFSLSAHSWFLYGPTYASICSVSKPTKYLRKCLLKAVNVEAKSRL